MSGTVLKNEPSDGFIFTEPVEGYRVAERDAVEPEVGTDGVGLSIAELSAQLECPVGFSPATGVIVAF